MKGVLIIVDHLVQFFWTNKFAVLSGEKELVSKINEFGVSYEQCAYVNNASNRNIQRHDIIVMRHLGI